MGTTLTGTTPQDTYDSLIKVTDNGPLTGSLKKLTDGLGNDSSLSLSTAAASVTGTLAVSSTTALNNAVTITGPNVGNSSLIVKNADNANSGEILLGGTTFGTKITRDSVGADQDLLIVNSHGTPQGFKFRTGATTAGTTDLMVITGAGNVGIGLTNPIQKFGVSDGTNAFYVTHDANGPYIQAVNNGNTVYKRQTYDAIDHVFLISASERARFTANGLTFNGDTDSANALDDYEEGTWTIGITFGGAAVGVTTLNNTGTYTKIGRQVTVNGRLSLTSKGSSTGVAAITGLPFTQINNENRRSAPSFRFANISFANVFQGLAALGTTTINLEEITEAGSDGDLTNADFVNTSDIIISYTYFV
jgi:hypothetical protein